MTINFCEVCLATIICSIITIVLYIASWYNNEEEDEKKRSTSNMQGLENDRPVSRSEPNEIINLDANNHFHSSELQSTGKIIKEKSDICRLQDEDLRSRIVENDSAEHNIADDYVTIDRQQILSEYDSVVHPDGKTGRLHLSIRYDDERSKLIVRLLDAQGLILPAQIYAPEICLSFSLIQSSGTHDNEIEKHTRIVVENAAISWKEPCTFCSTFEHVTKGNLYIKASNQTDPAAIRDREVTIPLNNLGSQGEEINEWFDLQLVQSSH
ncbi:hypothetical protein I4U23_002156 [Adineta vaga]|nr:hypothetical protein I4U23_002156 [Adineta vaga]